ncbi:MAG: hypothetical protein ACYDD1_11795 [Caulobacteraceae bacterium]
MSATLFTAAGSAAGVVGVFIVLVRHMLAAARQQGARDERERQMAGRIDKLENRVEAVSTIEKRIVALDTTVQGWDKRFESLERSVRDGFDTFEQVVRDVLANARRRRRAAKTEEEG